MNKMIDACFDAKTMAYCPYSNFPVGASLVCQDGSVYTGKTHRQTDTQTHRKQQEREREREREESLTN